MQNWTIPDGDDTPFGGGAYVFQTSMAEFHNVSFSNNSAYGGGALAAQDANVTLNNVIIHSNSSTYRGSAIWQLAGNIISTNSLIYNNSYVVINQIFQMLRLHWHLEVVVISLSIIQLQTIMGIPFMHTLKIQGVACKFYFDMA